MIKIIRLQVLSVKFWHKVFFIVKLWSPDRPIAIINTSLATGV